MKKKIRWPIDATALATIVLVFSGAVGLAPEFQNRSAFFIFLVAFGLLFLFTVWRRIVLAAYILGATSAIAAAYSTVPLIRFGFTLEGSTLAAVSCAFTVLFWRWAWSRRLQGELLEDFLESDRLLGTSVYDENYRPDPKAFIRCFEQLVNPIEWIRIDACRRIRHMARNHLTLEQGLFALEFALREPSPQNGEFSDFRELEIVEAVAKSPHPEYIPFIRERLHDFTGCSQRELIGLTTAIDSPEAARFALRLMAEKDDMNRFYVFLDLQNNPKFPEIYFPNIFQAADDPSKRSLICDVALSFCKEGLLTPEQLFPGKPHLIATARDYLDRLPGFRPADTTGSNWRIESPYGANRHGTGRILDLLGRIEGDEESISILEEASNDRDPRIQCFALTSLLRQGRTVEPDRLNAIANDFEMLCELIDELEELGLRSLLRDAAPTQEMIARCEFVNWLASSSKVELFPDAIELLEIVTVEAEGDEQTGLIDHFLFRFRIENFLPATDDGWLVGLAGPYARNEQPTTKSLGPPNSRFGNAEDNSPSEHVDKILKAA